MIKKGNVLDSFKIKSFNVSGEGSKTLLCNLNRCYIMFFGLDFDGGID